MTGEFIYHTYPFPFPIAMIKSGYYAGGNYYYAEADQFASKQILDAHVLLTCQKEEVSRIPRTCKSCAKVCHNLTVYGDCCMYEPMEGLYVI
jgi:hypothetical protein